MCLHPILFDSCQAHCTYTYIIMEKSSLVNHDVQKCQPGEPNNVRNEQSMSPEREQRTIVSSMRHLKRRMTEQGIVVNQTQVDDASPSNQQLYDIMQNILTKLSEVTLVDTKTHKKQQEKKAKQIYYYEKKSDESFMKRLKEKYSKDTKKVVDVIPHQYVKKITDKLFDDENVDTQEQYMKRAREEIP